jgi:FkbM family methyltransferase
MTFTTFCYKVTNKLLKLFGFRLIEIQKFNEIPIFTNLWNAINEDKKSLISQYLIFSKSQYAQDLFVISQLVEKDLPKYFIEFGATNGISWSNTYILEKYFKWDGILSEPARTWEIELRNNRNCIIDTRCVYQNSKDFVEFSETLNPNSEFAVSSPELSTISKFTNNKDWASNIRKNNSIRYLVETVSLNDLLIQHNAPYNIGYLSIDTEGSELEILRNFDFTKYKIEIISVEHNHNKENRNELYELLVKNGYKRKHDNMFGADDIYVL